MAEGNNTAKVTAVYPQPQPKFNLMLTCSDGTPQDAIDTKKLVLGNTYTHSYGNGDFYSVIDDSSKAKCALKIPDKLLKPSTTYKVAFDLYTSNQTHGISTGVNFGDKRISSDAKVADKTYTITFTTPEVLSGNKVLFFVAATVEDWDSISVRDSRITPVSGADNLAIKATETAKLIVTLNNTGETDLHDIVITGTLPDVINLASPIESEGITGNLQQGIRIPVVTLGKSVVFSFTIKPDTDLLDIGDNKVTITLSATAKELEQEPDAADNSVDITIQKPEPPKLRPEEVKEVKLANNEILDDDRKTLIKPIFKAVKGLKFTPLIITTEGHGWYEIGDRIAIENGKEQWQAVITNIKLTVDGGIKEEIKSIAPTNTTTNYALAGGIKKTIYNTEIKVDKQNQNIEQIISRQEKQDANTKEEFAKIKQDITGVTTTIQEAGGTNLLHNSVGFDTENNGKLVDWKTKGEVKPQSSPESQASGAVSGNQIAFGKSAKIVQRVAVAPGREYSISFKARKSFLGTAKLTLTNDRDTFAIELPTEKETPWQDYSIVGFKPAQSYVDVAVETDGTVSDFAITDLMFNTGNSTIPWTQAAGETLSTGVSVTKHGIKVRSTLHNGDYVEMTPLEFAGYSTVGGNLDKVFSLNRDTTNIQKLNVVNKIIMPPMELVPITTGEHTGWAVIKASKEYN